MVDGEDAGLDGGPGAGRVAGFPGACAMKNVPATAPVMRQASVAASSARGPTAARSFRRAGTSAAIPPTKIASDATCAKPHRA
jgi:hypothetical protein